MWAKCRNGPGDMTRTGQKTDAQGQPDFHASLMSSRGRSAQVISKTPVQRSLASLRLNGTRCESSLERLSTTHHRSQKQTVPVAKLVSQLDLLRLRFGHAGR